jgi:hypothetical protein
LSWWLKQRLSSTLGVPPTIGPPAGATSAYAQGLPNVLAQFAAELGKGVAMGLTAWGPLANSTIAQGGACDGEAKQGYSTEDIGALMGFACVHRGQDRPTIWDYFNKSKGKNINNYRRNITTRTKQWAYSRHIEIDKNIYLEQDTIKAIVDLKLNPGKGVAHLLSASKGLSILMCWACTSAETECIWECEHAMAATEGTQQFDKLLRLSKGATRALTKKIWELKVNIATFMLLVWVLFSSECDYYKGLRQVYNTFEMKEVGLLKASFTPEYCRWVTWAILNNGWSYFDDVKTMLDFQGPDQIIFPQSYIIDISRNIGYATPVEQANFPDE